MEKSTQVRAKSESISSSDKIDVNFGSIYDNFRDKFKKILYNFNL